MSLAVPRRVLRASKPVNIAPLDDAMLGELARLLGLENPHTLRDLIDADPLEIEARQKVVEYIGAHQGRFSSWSLDFDGTPSSETTMPRTSGVDFMKYRNQLSASLTPFWKRMKGFFFTTEGASVPSRIRELRDSLKTVMDQRYTDELALADEIVADMRQALNIAGVLNIELGYFHLSSIEGGRQTLPKLFADGEFPVIERACFGTMPFHPNLDTPFVPHVPQKWTRWIGRQAAAFKNKRAQKKRLDPARLYSIPRCLYIDVLSYINTILQGARISLTPGLSKISLKVAYWLEGGKLTIQIVSYNYDYSPSFADEVIPKIEFGEAADDEAISKFSKNMGSCLSDTANLEIRQRINNKLLPLVRTYSNLDAPETFKEYSVAIFEKIIGKYSDRIDEIIRWQTGVEQALNDLVMLHHMIEKIHATGLPTVMPAIVTGKNVLELSGAYPVRLQSLWKARPFGAFSINGRMVNFTGRNGSGKSTALMVALDAQILTQIGMMVFAEKAAMSLKSFLLLSFLERRSDESTFMVKLKKDQHIADTIGAMSEADRASTLVIIDELGGGTTQDSVLSVVEPFVKWLNSKEGVSTLISTQIPQLSRFIGDELHGINFVIKPNYALEEGVGEGEPQLLARDIGFFESIAK